MKIIGITGGVGAGKTTILQMLKKICSCRVIVADELAKSLMNRGGALENDAIRLFGGEAYDSNGLLNRAHLAQVIFNNERIKREWNALVHPAVNKAIFDTIEAEKKKNEIDFLFIEAALLIENGYDSICDELWYVFAEEKIRISRLSHDRGYSEEKSQNIIKSQMDEATFRAKCDFVIDTGMSLEDTETLLKNRLEEYNKL